MGYHSSKRVRQIGIKREKHSLFDCGFLPMSSNWSYGYQVKYFKYLVILIGILIFAFIGLVAYLGLMTAIKGFTFNYWIDGGTALLFISGFSFIGYKLSNKINIGRR